jgi:hypothetical protein
MRGQVVGGKYKKEIFLKKTVAACKKWCFISEFR